MGTLSIPDLPLAPPQQHRSARRPQLVILDDGLRARIATLPAELAPSIGSRFALGGCRWEIRSRRDHARAWVAVPVES